MCPTSYAVRSSGTTAAWKIGIRKRRHETIIASDAESNLVDAKTNLLMVDVDVTIGTSKTWEGKHEECQECKGCGSSTRCWGGSQEISPLIHPMWTWRNDSKSDRKGKQSRRKGKKGYCQSSKSIHYLARITEEMQIRYVAWLCITMQSCVIHTYICTYTYLTIWTICMEIATCLQTVLRIQVPYQVIA